MRKGSPIWPGLSPDCEHFRGDTQEWEIVSKYRNLRCCHADGNPHHHAQPSAEQFTHFHHRLRTQALVVLKQSLYHYPWVAQQPIEVLPERKRTANAPGNGANLVAGLARIAIQ